MFCLSGGGRDGRKERATRVTWGDTRCFRPTGLAELSFVFVNKQTLAGESTCLGKILRSLLFILRAGFGNLKLGDQSDQLCFGGIDDSGKITFYQPSKVNCN